MNVNSILSAMASVHVSAQHSCDVRIIFRFILVAPTNQAQSSHPSFDCSKATTPTDITICATAELAALDVNNMSVYKQAKLINPNLTKSIWRESIKYKYACGTEVDCIEHIYQKSISLYGCVIKNARCQNDIVF